MSIELPPKAEGKLTEAAAIESERAGAAKAKEFTGKFIKETAKAGLKAGWGIFSIVTLAVFAVKKAYEGIEWFSKQAESGKIELGGGGHGGGDHGGGHGGDHGGGHGGGH